VGVGLGITGVATYGFFGITSRVLDPGDYDAIGVLWSLLFALGNGLMQPLEQEVARAVSDRRATGLGAAPIVRLAARIGLAFTGVVVLLALATRSWVLDELLDGQTGLEIAFLVGLVGFCIAHLTRGTLSSHGRFRAYAVFFGVEGTFRLVLAGVLAVVGVEAVGPYGALLALAPYAGSAVALVGQRHLLEDGPPARWGELSRNLGWLLLGSLSLSLLLQVGTPTIQALATPEQEGSTGAFLNALVIARIPLFLFQAVLASLLPRLAHLAGEGRLVEFTTTLRRLVGVILGLGVVIVAVAALFGPPVIEVVFGSQEVLGRRDLAMLATASIVIMAAVCLDQALIALSAHSRMALGWLLALMTFAGVVALGDDLFWRVELGLVAAAFVGLAWMATMLAMRLRRGTAIVEEVEEVDFPEAIAEMPIQP
jgi:O-antigen/teichoic acid export membrane protein